MHYTLKIIVRFLGNEQSSDPLAAEAAHRKIESLREYLSRLSGLTSENFTFLQGSYGGVRSRADIDSVESEVSLFSGLELEVSLDRLYVAMRSLIDGLKKSAQRFRCEIQVPPSYFVSLESSQPEDLVGLLIASELILPKEYAYQNKVIAYMNTFGELTPAAISNLNLFRQRMELSAEDANNFNAAAAGPFKKLDEKYSHFRTELSIYKKSGDLTEEVWHLMGEKARHMRLPEEDAQFLKEEFLSSLRDQAEEEARREEKKAQLLHRQQQEKQRKISDYRENFKELIIRSLSAQIFAQFDRESEIFKQNILTGLSSKDFSEGSLRQLRKFYGFNQEEVDNIENAFLEFLHFYVFVIILTRFYIILSAPSFSGGNFFFLLLSKAYL